MKLLVYSIIVFALFACNSTKTIPNLSSSTIQEPTITLTVLIDGANNQPSLNDVISECAHIKSFKSFSVNFLTPERTELKLMYGEISTSQRQELYSRLNCIGVKVITASGF